MILDGLAAFVGWWFLVVDWNSRWTEDPEGQREPVTKVAFWIAVPPGVDLKDVASMVGGIQRGDHR